MHAYGNDDLTTIDVLTTYTVTRKEIANYPWGEVLDVDGNPAGASLNEVVDYMNSQFEYTGGTGGVPPDITSPLTASVVEGTAFSYSITADHVPNLYLASGLPAGLSCNPSTGVISGVTSVLGPHNIMITAINAYGSDTETLVVTVLVAGGYHNSSSVRFRDHIYQHHLVVNTSAAINDGSNDPWSITAWVYVNNITTNMDLFAQGNTSGKGYRHIYMDTSGRIVLTFYRSGLVRTYRTQESLTPAAWVQLSVVYAAAPSCAIYFNGVAKTVDLVTNTLSAESKGTSNMRIGRGPGIASDAYWMDGYLDEWVYWNIALSAGQVTSVYNGGVPHDLTLLGFAANMMQWLLMGDGDSYPVLTDNAAGNVHDATMTNMTAFNIINFVP
jgi:hypothetical protein